MRSDAFLLRACLGAAAAFSLLGCAEDELAPPFVDGSGQLPPDAAAYPTGPYGISIGSTVVNYKFVGYATPATVKDRMQEIRLSDFYNPTGAEVFPEDSPYGAGMPKPKALLIDVSSVWCPPCNEEADVVLPVQYAKYKPMGGEFLLQLADGPTLGKPAEPKHLYNWTTKYNVDYPAAIDPTYKLGALFEADAFPANMIIRTKDMKIIEVISGAPPVGSTFWTLYERVLKDEPVLPGE